jgi:uncharacterized membrane protein HdeD (DUF308 family)
MELSLFLAKLFGLYMLSVALIALVRKEQFQSVITSILSSEGLLAVMGIINLIIGLAILIGHPVVELSWRSVITLLGLISLVQGFARIGFASEIQKKWTLEKTEKHYWAFIVVLLMVGLFLTYHGFRG